MNVNLIWSVLAAGKPVYESYGRRVDGLLYERTSTRAYNDLLALVPYTDSLHRAYRIEQLTQLVLTSELRDRALALDPVNLYEKAVLSFPERTRSVAEGVPVSVQFHDSDLVQDDAYPGVVYVTAAVDPAAMTVEISGETRTFTFSNGLSSLITIMAGRQIRMSGELPAASFDLFLTYIGQTHVDWAEVMTSIADRDFLWSDGDLRRVWLEDLSWVNKIAAATLSTVENLSAA